MIQTRLLNVALTLVLFGGISQTVFSQIPCSVNSVGLDISEDSFCEDAGNINAQVDFTANIDTEGDSVFLQGFPPTSNFQSAFQHTFPTEDNGCLYAMRITGSYSVWSNTTQLADARYRFDPITNALLNQADPPGMNISTPDYFAPQDYNPNHEYWYFYQGDGRDVSFDFSETGGYADNSGDMTFDWFVIPCFDTLWTIDGIDFSGGNARSFSWQSEGTYDVSLLITDIVSGCSDMATGQIKVNIRPEITVTTTAACDMGESGSAEAFINSGTGTNPFLYNWSTGNPDAAFAENLPPGGHQVTVVDSENCRDTVDFTISAKTPPLLMLDASDPSCEGIENGLIELVNPNVDWTYSLDGNIFQSTPLFQNLGIGDYSFYIDDGDGCIYSDSATLSSPTVFSVDLPAEIIVNEGEQFTLTPIINPTGNFDYNWLPFENLDCPDCEITTGSMTESGAVTVTVSDENGCSAQATVFVRVQPAEILIETDIFVPNAFSPNNDGINDFFTVFTDMKKVTQINNLSVYDRYGGLMFLNQNFEPNDETMGWNGENSGKPMDIGVYTWFAEIELIDGSKTIAKGEVSLVR